MERVRKRAREAASPKTALDLLSDITLKEPEIGWLRDALRQTSVRENTLEIDDYFVKTKKHKFTVIRNGSLRCLLEIPKQLLLLEGFRYEGDIISAMEGLRKAIQNGFQKEKTWDKRFYIIRPLMKDPIHESVLWIFDVHWRSEGIEAKYIEISAFKNAEVLRAGLDLIDLSETERTPPGVITPLPELPLSVRCSAFIEELRDAPDETDLRPIIKNFHEFNKLLGEVKAQYKIDDELYGDLIDLQSQITSLRDKIKNWDNYLNDAGAIQASTKVKKLFVTEVLPKIEEVQKTAVGSESERRR